MSLRTDRLPRLPIQMEVRHIVTASTRLPTGIGAHWSYHLNPKLLLAPDDPIRLGIAGIDQMFFWQQLPFQQNMFNRLHHRHVGERRLGGLNVGNQQRSLFVACLRQMDLVAGPHCLTLGRKTDSVGEFI
jgi:hypothetical protein